MRNDVNGSGDPIRPPRWAEALLHAVLRPADAEVECGDLLEAYRDSIYPNRGRRRANLWYARQVVGYVVRSHPRNWSPRLTSTLVLMGISLPVFTVVIAFGGGLILLFTMFGSVAALVAAPIIWLAGKHRAAGKILAGLGAYVSFYLVVSTAVSVIERIPPENPRGLGQEVCADAGCFAVDKVERTATGSETIYTLSWHLSSRDTEGQRRFPGKGLELYMFDDRSRRFALAGANDQDDPLDVILRAGETVHQTIAFRVPSDARELFLTARYRPFTFQGLLPGALSLLPRPHAKMIRIQ